MSSLSIQDIAHLARLSRLELSGEEAERFAGQLSSVVGYVEQLSSVTIEKDQVQKGMSGLMTVLAADEPRTQDDLAAVSREELLKGAPAQDGGYILVKAVLSTDEGGA